MTITVNEAHALQLFQALLGVGLQLLVRNVKVGFECANDAVKSNSRLARFDRYPYTGGNRIQAVTETLTDIEQDRPIFGVRPPNLGRNSPCRAFVCVHLPPPYDEWKLTKREGLTGIPQAPERSIKLSDSAILTHIRCES